MRVDHSGTIAPTHKLPGKLYCYNVIHPISNPTVHVLATFSVVFQHQLFMTVTVIIILCVYVNSENVMTFQTIDYTRIQYSSKLIHNNQNSKHCTQND